MKNSPLEQLKSLLAIEDSEARKEATIAFWGTLSDSEKTQVIDALVATAACLTESFQVISDVLGQVANDQLNHLSEWWNNNPELQTYINTLKEHDTNKEAQHVPESNHHWKPGS